MYTIILLIGYIIARLISLFNKKISNFFYLRKGESNRTTKFFSGIQNKKVIWFHATSAGEFEQAKPLIEYFRKNFNNIQIITSFFSPSGYAAGIKYENIDFCFNLPFDFKSNIKKLLDCINPHIIIYAKYDVWRNLTTEAKARGIKLILISGTLPEKSFRHKFPARYFFSVIYGNLDKIYAISFKDGERFKKIANDDNILISGDTRFERIRDVINSVDNKGRNIIKKKDDLIYLLAGSTYKKTEKILISIIKKINNKNYNTKLRLVLVPHEVNEKNIKKIKCLIKSFGIMPLIFSEGMLPLPVPENSILVIDKIGILALLYKEADIVFIGGSFKGSVHSVLEPAIFGKPIITGPYIQNSREALEMRESGCLISCKNKNELYDNIIKLMDDSEYRQIISRKSKEYFEKNSGAVEYIIKDIKSLLSFLEK